MKKFHTKDFLGKFSITIYSVIALAMLGLLSSCQSEEDLDSVNTRSTFLEFNITMPLASVTTSQGYENGTIEENSISNYRIYFYDTDNKYIMSLESPSLSIEDTDLNTIYTITAEITDEEGNNPLDGYSTFKIVMLANWETYTEPEVESTIDDLCNSEYAQYSAFTGGEDFDLATSGKHIPYYGVHQYTNVTFPKDGTVYLNGNLTLLRAMAKVEIVIDCEDDEDDNITLASATLHNYNSKGYSAPKSVYSQDDYGQATNWASDYTGENIHLVGDKNDSGEKTLSLYKVQDKQRDASSGQVTQKETWIAYVPEYDNTSNQGTVNDDFSYIDIKFDHQLDDDLQDYKIYFAVYDEDGTTQAYDSGAGTDEIAKRRDIHRNNLYRFNVDFGQYGLKVNVKNWEYVFDNEWTFGDMSRILDEGEEFSLDEGKVMYKILTIDEDGDPNEPVGTVQLIYVGHYDSFTIPETITYLGYTYTVVSIGAYCFDADVETQFISIPATVTSIESEAFHGDSNLVAIALHSTTPPTCAEDTFEDDDITRITIYVPKGYKDAYQNDSIWGQFTIEERDF